MLITVCTLLTIYSTTNAEDAYVKTPLGTIVGKKSYTVNGKAYYAYQGIPYAEPPTNEYRFQAPRPKNPWSHILDAREQKSMCYQTYDDFAGQSEDCLFVNVFTPASPSSNASFPVMFWIYGGGFVSGSADVNNFGPQHLIEHDVILVTHNYRIGPMGFLSTGDTVIPGNAGLKDQNMAMQWTKENIGFFGGDPSKVTIFGQSAGGASVSYHLLSPKSKGLFRAAIAESSSALSPFAYQRRQVEITYHVAQYINPSEFHKHNGSSSQLLKYLISVPAKTINVAARSVWYPHDVQLMQGFYYAPVLETEHEGAFITKKMFDSFKRGEINNVPLMTGITSEECIYLTSDKYFPDMTKNLDSDHTIALPRDMNVKENLRKEAGDQIYEFYSRGQTFAQNTTNQIRYHSDQAFTRSVIKQAELQSRYGQVWFYQFSYYGQIAGGEKSVTGFSDKVWHSSELSYLFAFNQPGHNTTDIFKYPEMDVTVVQRVINLWTNFAKYMNPTPYKTSLLQNIIWPTVDSNFTYLDIGSYLLLRNHPKKDSYNLWEKVYAKYGVPPYDTY